ncbi:Phospholipase D delta [Morella rubra]|uniref:Phospholipase D delta n=1 Tax=Morella rubra TaxID=262757 RepID=A0A6A1UNK6_9ROSI|nr:Phospholipase D delta [Morella rubra]
MAEESGTERQRKVIYLHGDLDLRIVEARQLPNMDVVTQHMRRCFTLCDTIKLPDSAAESDGRGDDRKVKHHSKIITSDPYVKVTVPHATLARTRVLKNTQNPRWNESFYIPLAHPTTNLEFEVKDDDLFGAELIGTVRISARIIASGELIADWFPIECPPGKPQKLEPGLRLEMKFTPFEKNPLYQHGIAGDPEHKGVRHTYFPLRRGCSTTLYQDAHVLDRMLPEIELDDGKVFKQEKCWEDLCYAISDAHHLIYIIGWSIYHQVRLVREQTRQLPRGGNLTLGELLKYKSEEGVRVLLLVWDDKTSHDKLLIKTVSMA